MNDLIARAKQLLDGRYVRHVHTVAAVLETKSGAIFEAVNIDHFSAFVCAEMAVLSMAINAGETEFSQVVAVRREKDGVVDVANPCGKCRQIFFDYSPGILMAVRDEDHAMMRSVEQLLPYSFDHQRNKISTALQVASDEVMA